MKKQILLVDSNVLFTRNDVELVNKDFLETLRQCRTYSSLELWIPRICLAEIIFQKVTFAQARLNEAHKSIRIIAELADVPPLTVAKEDSVARAIARRLLRWCKENSVVIPKVPFKKMDWKSIAQSAVWHIAPFSPPSTDKEKGFKDCLVLETILDVWSTNDTAEVTFVTSDKLLYDTVKGRVSKTPGFTVFSSMDDLLSHLRLAHEAKTKAFSDALIKNATVAFFEADNPACVYNRFNVRDELYKAGAFSLSESEWFHAMNVALPPTANWLSTNLNLPAPKRWQAMSEDRIWINPPAYLKTNAQGWYQWRSEISVVKLYREVVETRVFNRADYIRFAPFSVFWRCKADVNGAITEAQFESVSAGPVKAEVATDVLRRQYGLPTEIDLLMRSLASNAVTSQPSLSGQGS